MKNPKSVKKPHSFMAISQGALIRYP